MSLVMTPEAKPAHVSLARSVKNHEMFSRISNIVINMKHELPIISSIVSNLRMDWTGPKISSLAILIPSLTPENTVG